MITAGYSFTRGLRSATDKSRAASASAEDPQPSRERGSGWWGSAKKSSGAVANDASANRPRTSRSAGEPGGDDVDPELREYLREWRRLTSRQLKTAAFIIMHDSSLNEICRLLPKSLEEIRKVSGFGERKTELYGPQILGALERFRKGARATAEA
jgi:superfamily II DNA helicase RecQ